MPKPDTRALSHGAARQSASLYTGIYSEERGFYKRLYGRWSPLTLSPRSNMRIPRAKIRLTAISPLSWHPPPGYSTSGAAGRAHRPGSRRLGGVEATGASPGVAPSRPHRLGPPAPPGWCARCLAGGWGPGGGGGGAPTWPVRQIAPWGRGLRPESGRAIARTAAQRPMRARISETVRSIARAR